jgi:hypothetical protein
VPIVAARFNIPSDKSSIDAALEGLTQLNMTIMRAAAAAGQPFPSVYKAGVYWKRDVGETWDTVDVVQRRGFGDCEDLAAWLAASYRVKGIGARAVVRASNTPGVAWHAVTQLPSGGVEDPSVRLGMHRGNGFRPARTLRLADGVSTTRPPEPNLLGMEIGNALRREAATLAAVLRRLERGGG